MSHKRRQSVRSRDRSPSPIKGSISRSESSDSGSDHQKPTSDLIKQATETGETQFQAVMALLAMYSDMQLAPVKETPHRGQFSLDSEQVNEKRSHVGLTTSNGVKRALELWAQDFYEQDDKRAKRVKLGELFKCRSLRPSMNPYRSGDSYIPLEPLQQQSRVFLWLSNAPNKVRIPFKELHALEGMQREALRVLNYKEAINQTLNAGREKSFDAAVMEALHKSAIQADKDVIGLVVHSLCSLIQLKRDTILEKSDRLSKHQVSRLRHCSFAKERELFNADLLKQIDDEVNTELSNKVLTGQVHGKSSSSSKHKHKPSSRSGSKSESHRQSR